MKKIILAERKRENLAAYQDDNYIDDGMNSWLDYDDHELMSYHSWSYMQLGVYKEALNVLR
jgi:hypothetical protein